MRKALKNSKGFTLIELMIVVAIIGILAAVAIPIYMSFMDDAKTSEASIQLKSMGDGALAYYQKGNLTNAQDLALGGSIASTSNKYLTPANSKDGAYADTCTSTGNGLGEEQVPNPDDFEASPFVDLKFSIAKPHYYEYCYTGTDIAFEAVATASFAAVGDSVFTLVGAIQDNQPVVGTAREGVAAP